MNFHSRKATRAFNLVESAIVLGVVGIVIGGIWFAAASIRENRRVTDLRTAVISIHNRAMQLYSTRNVPPGNTVMAQDAQQSGIITSDWIYQASGYYINSSGDQIQLVLAGTPCAGLTGAILAVRFITSRAVCTKLVSGMGGARSNIGAFFWTTQNVCQLANTTPMTFADAQTRCTANATFSMQMLLGSSN